MAIAFASREVADEWWRALSTHPEIGKYIKRSTPQLYQWIKLGNFSPEINDYFGHQTFMGSLVDVVSPFASKMAFLNLNTNGSYFYEPPGSMPVQDAPDLASGNA